MVLVGWALTVLGLAFIVVGLMGAYKDVTRRSPRNGDRNPPAGNGFWAELIKILPALLEQLFKAPKWFLSCLVGIVLIYCGVRLINGLSLLPMG
ncbi:MAG: hypothetical protein ACREOO_31725 [bacterium]